ncbi:EAL domain-containing protein [Lacimicrobium sp. SS2-24]|uniref:putative bifunctional diguanylate cyclase/phosphodiesterase n=1 Tax=Lacimicrobium sp. SS2-24 TaxID=2005569 RepID=UPI000B4B7CBE|nr:EAL domain-containing protein [Lacimicrobium sp. SS2-24]
MAESGNTSQFTNFFHSSAQPMLLLSAFNIVDANTAALHLLGCDSAEQLCHQHLRDWLSVEVLNNAELTLSDVSRKGQGKANWIWLTPEKKAIEAECFLTRMSESPEPLVHCCLRQVSQHGPGAQVQLQLYQQMFDGAADAIIITDTNETILYANRAFSEMLGYSLSELAGNHVRLIRSSKHEQPFYEQIRQNLEEKGFWAGEIWDKSRSGEENPRQVRLSAIVDEHRKPSYFVGVYTDIDSKDSRMLHLEEMAYHDDLTGLPNRALLMQLLPHQISQCQRTESGFALMFLDLDKFKPVNDMMGHDAGDLMLKEVAGRFCTVLRNSDTVARLGGDEFVILVTDVRSAESVSRVAQKIHQCLEQPFLIKGQQVYISTSIGISMYPDTSAEPETLINQADIAMYRAKKRGENQHVFYCEDLNQEVVRFKQVEREIRDALIRSEFVPYYQPQIDSRTDKIVGVECLARWLHKDKGVISPADFIAVAEKSGLIQEMFMQVLARAITDIGDWKKRFDADLQVSVNISGNQFCDQHNIQQMSEMLKDSGVSPDKLKTEITESSLMDNGQYLLERLSWVKTAGFSIALDHFGSGYSSLRQLQNLPLDSLKIDSSFVTGMASHPRDKVIIKAIIQLSKTLGIDVVAQGVEDAEQVTFLKQQGCHVMQGYHFSHPLPVQEFALLLEQKGVGTSA